MIEPDDFGDEDFLASIKAKLSPERQVAVDTLSKVKSVYVTCGRDRLLADQFGRFFELMLATRGEQRDDGRAFFVTGESGAGKSRAVAHLLQNFSPLAPQHKSFGTIKPVVTVSLRGPCTLAMLGRRILKVAGYPVRQDMEQGKLWDMLPEQLHHRKVLVVHLDETQHMIRQTEKDSERKDLAKAFKSVMNYEPWPVSFIMSGMPQTTELSRLDEQIERRGSFFILPPVSLPEERVLVTRVVEKLVHAAGLAAPGLTETDVPERIAHAARYQFGRIAQVVLAAIACALGRGATVLDRGHFALAYLDHSHARGRDEMNPFLVEDWRMLEPGSFLQEARKA